MIIIVIIIIMRASPFPRTRLNAFHYCHDRFGFLTEVQCPHIRPENKTIVRTYLNHYYKVFRSNTMKAKNIPSGHRMKMNKQPESIPERPLRNTVNKSFYIAHAQALVTCLRYICVRNVCSVSEHLPIQLALQASGKIAAIL